MSDEAKDAKLWRDFRHTMRVITASALAQHDLAATGGRAAPRVTTFTFDLLAAAAAADVRLPERRLSTGSELAAELDDSRAGEIRLSLQLKGFAALKENAGRPARLVSANGAIDYAFRFGDHGGAVCVLADMPEVRDGLKAFSVLVEQE
jgi:hypothetical protein